MSIGNSSQRDAYFVTEAVTGEIPATPAFNHIRTTGGSLNLRKNTRTSNEINSDRQVKKLIYGSERVEGDISFELSHGSFDELLSYALMNSWSGNTLKTGNDLKTFTVEEIHRDVGEYIRSKACGINTLSLSIGLDDVTGTFSVLGRTQETSKTAIVDSTYTSPTNTDVVDGYGGQFTIDSVTSPIITQVDLQLENGLETREALGGALLPPKFGKSNLTGTISAYFENLDLYNKFRNEEDASLNCSLSDGTNTLGILIPKINFTDPDRPVEGESDIILSLPFQAIYDETEQSNVVITR